jgi:hypothetical protein
MLIVHAHLFSTENRFKDKQDCGNCFCQAPKAWVSSRRDEVMLYGFLSFDDVYHIVTIKCNYLLPAGLLKKTGS